MQHNPNLSQNWEPSPYVDLTPENEGRPTINCFSTVVSEIQLKNLGFSVVKPEFGTELSSKFDLAKLLNLSADQIGNDRWLVPTNLVAHQSAAKTRRLDWQKLIEKRFATLDEAAAEEGVQASQISRDCATQFIDDKRISVLPSIFLLDNGNFRLVWRDQSGQAGVQFLSDGYAQYVLLKSDSNVEHLGRDRQNVVLSLIENLGFGRLLGINA